ncbi:unnamed protein product [Cylindrotheca closterium]|uniref:EamA domain-containing protein n=1 Tax=Cylindrotheca closterium TaxID=2856 RepID=A0AAD2JH52_9STRA|nr:unnamed protein product [Cylindrotheca closterium]
MMSPTASDENDDPRNGAEETSSDTSENGFQPAPCHELKGRTNSKPFDMESSSSTDTLDYGDYDYSYPSKSSYICCCCNWIRRKTPTLDWKALALGQLVSFSLASAGAALATLNLDCHLNAPSFVVSLYYFILSWHVLLLWKRKRHLHHQPLDTEESSPDLTLTFNDEVSSTVPYNDHPNDVILRKESSSSAEDVSSSHSFFGLFPMHKPMWQYCMLALIDLEANVITASAFQYTTLTSITLFDNLAIPTAMLLSRCLFSRKYTWIHFGGVLICMVGVVVNMWQDYDDDQNIEEQEEYPHKLRGDLCAIAGGIMYGVSNVMVEVTIRGSSDSAEYLGIMGFFGFILATIQAWIVHPDEILAFFGYMELDGGVATCHTERWWILAAYVGCTAFAYAGASRFFQISEATFFALSLLTGDLWSVIFSVFFEHIIPHPLFFLALVFVLSGMLVYEMAPSPVLEDRCAVVYDEDANGGLRGSLPVSANNIHIAPSSNYVSVVEGEEADNSIPKGR